MQPTNKIKLSVGILIIALFVIGLFSGFGKNQSLLAPTPAFAVVAATTPASTNPADPTIISSLRPTLSLVGPVTGADYYIYRVSKVGPAPSYSLLSPVYTSAPETSLTHQITTDLVRGQLLAFDAAACRSVTQTTQDIQTVQEECSGFSVRKIYFIIPSVTRAPAEEPILSPTECFIDDLDILIPVSCEVLAEQETLVAEPRAIQDHLEALPVLSPDCYYIEDVGVFTEFCPPTKPTTFLGQIRDAIEDALDVTIDAVVGAAEFIWDWVTGLLGGGDGKEGEVGVVPLCAIPYLRCRS